MNTCRVNSSRAPKEYSMVTIGLASIFSSYTAGFLTSLTPCVYPMIPLTLGYLGSKGNELNKKVILVFTSGQILMFGIMGFIAVELGEVFGFFSQNSWVQLGTGGLLISFAYYSWKKELPGFLNNLSQYFSSRTPTISKDKNPSLWAPFLLGLFSTLIASPCSTPVLAGVLALVAQSESRGQGVVLMAIYGMGISTLFMLLGLGLLKSKTLPQSGKWMILVHNFSMALLLVGGIYFIFNGVRSWIH